MGGHISSVIILLAIFDISHYKKLQKLADMTLNLKIKTYKEDQLPMKLGHS